MTTIQVRRGLAERWAFVNPVLASGEPGLETDTGFIKVGDGESAWNDLGYLPHYDHVVYTMAGSGAGLGVTEVELSMDGLALKDIGVLVASDMECVEVTASWKSDNIPAGDWTLQLLRRPSGLDTIVPEATFTISTA